MHGPIIRKQSFARGVGGILLVEPEVPMSNEGFRHHQRTRWQRRPAPAGLITLFAFVSLFTLHIRVYLLVWTRSLPGYRSFWAKAVGFLVYIDIIEDQLSGQCISSSVHCPHLIQIDFDRFLIEQYLKRNIRRVIQFSGLHLNWNCTHGYEFEYRKQNSQILFSVSLKIYMKVISRIAKLSNQNRQVLADDSQVRQ